MRTVLSFGMENDDKKVSSETWEENEKVEGRRWSIED